MRIHKASFIPACISILLIINSCSLSNPDADTQDGPINRTQIDEAFASARQMPGLRSLIVKQRGNIIKEEYFGSADADKAYNVMSVTKSVTSLLIGIAIDKGYIQSLDQKISDFISPIVTGYPADKKDLTIRHLITMSGGFQGNELTNPELYIEWAAADNQINFILNVPLVYQPGTHFSYDSRPYHMLSAILTRATGKTTKEFAEQYLFTPLSIGSRGWTVDNQGYFTGSAGLLIKGQDMVKIGELVLYGGVYNGTRIVSSGYIAQLKESKISTQNAVPYSPGYSYGFWLGNYNNRDFVYGMGWGGQFIIVVPSLELVITAVNNVAGISYLDAGTQWQTTADLIMTRIVTAFNE